MDPEGGNQPIRNEKKSKAIVANGEIYNFPELYKTLSKDHHFSSKSDTEAILHLYEDKASAVVNHLDGMYAFAIADGEDLFIARDPIGIKPLYVGEKKDTFVFASELKAFSAGDAHIREFPPGCFFHTRTGTHTFYEVPEIVPEQGSVDMYCRLLRKTLEEAVTKRLMSDVPLGAFLSGGLDSSIIAAIARKHIDKLHTFSVGIEGSNDIEAARRVARHLDTIHHEYLLDKDEIKQHLPEIIYYLESFDQDLVRSAVPCYFTSRLASDFVKVILTGEGADELFAGYQYYKSITAEDFLHKELRRSIASLHNINLQRVDRMTMAHSIEGRVPFLDLQMIELGQLIPPELKLSSPPVMEKWILRKAFEDLLPKDIVWRKKEQFDEGSGSVTMLKMIVDEEMSSKEAKAYGQKFSDADLRSNEECCYHRHFMSVFDNPVAILPNVGRWAQRPEEVG